MYKKMFVIKFVGWAVDTKLTNKTEFILQLVR